MFIETWKAAKDEPESGELTHRQWGDYRKRHITHGWWVQPGSWALGIGFDREARTVCWDGRATFTAEVGPFCWALTLHHPRKAKP